jgi:hypothetical protein
MSEPPVQSANSVLRPEPIGLTSCWFSFGVPESPLFKRRLLLRKNHLDAILRLIENAGDEKLASPFCVFCEWLKRRILDHCYDSWKIFKNFSTNYTKFKVDSVSSSGFKIVFFLENGQSFCILLTEDNMEDMQE